MNRYLIAPAFPVAPREVMPAACRGARAMRDYVDSDGPWGGSTVPYSPDRRLRAAVYFGLACLLLTLGTSLYLVQVLGDIRHGQTTNGCEE